MECGREGGAHSAEADNEYIALFLKLISMCPHMCLLCDVKTLFFCYIGETFDILKEYRSFHGSPLVSSILATKTSVITRPPVPLAWLLKT